MELDAEQALHHALLDIVVNYHAHHLTVKNLGQHVAARDGTEYTNAIRDRCEACSSRAHGCAILEPRRLRWGVWNRKFDDPPLHAGLLARRHAGELASQR